MQTNELKQQQINKKQIKQQTNKHTCIQTNHTYKQQINTNKQTQIGILLFLIPVIHFGEILSFVVPSVCSFLVGWFFFVSSFKFIFLFHKENFNAFLSLVVSQFIFVCIMFQLGVGFVVDSTLAITFGESHEIENIFQTHQKNNSNNNDNDVDFVSLVKNFFLALWFSLSYIGFLLHVGSKLINSFQIDFKKNTVRLVFGVLFVVFLSLGTLVGPNHISDLFFSNSFKLSIVNLSFRKFFLHYFWNMLGSLFWILAMDELLLHLFDFLKEKKLFLFVYNVVIAPIPPLYLDLLMVYLLALFIYDPKRFLGWKCSFFWWQFCPTTLSSGFADRVSYLGLNLIFDVFHSIFIPATLFVCSLVFGHFISLLLFTLLPFTSQFFPKSIFDAKLMWPDKSFLSLTAAVAAWALWDLWFSVAKRDEIWSTDQRFVSNVNQYLYSDPTVQLFFTQLWNKWSFGFLCFNFDLFGCTVVNSENNARFSPILVLQSNFQFWKIFLQLLFSSFVVLELFDRNFVPHNNKNIERLFWVSSFSASLFILLLNWN